MYTLDPAVIAEARRLFDPRVVEDVLRRLATERLPMERSGPPSRVHIAVVWLSGGDLRRFDGELRAAARDWRDTLLAAGLANEDWKSVLNAKGIDARKW